MNAPDIASQGLSLIESLFPAVFRASVLGGCGILLVMAVRRIGGRRLAPSFRLALWLPALLLLVMPRLPEVGLRLAAVDIAPIKVDSSNHAPAFIATEDTFPAAAPDDFAVPTADPPINVIADPPPASLAWSQIAAGAWFIVTLMLVLACIAAHLAWRRKVFRVSATPSCALSELFADCCRALGLSQTPRLVASPALENPVVTGVAQPCVIVPAGIESSLTPAELRHVLLHEAAHVRRGDLWWQCAWFGVLAAHWFNPLVWLAMRLARADREAACDATALTALPGDGRLDYGTTLLRIQERLSHSASPRFVPAIAGSTDLLRERILDISRHGRRSPRAGLAAIVLMTLAAGVMAALAAEPPKPDAPAAEASPLPTQAPAPAPAPDTAINVPPGTTICRIRMEFVKPMLDDADKRIEEFIQKQVDLLGDDAVRQQAERRADTLRPSVPRVPVTIVPSRVPGSLQLDVSAAGPAGPYVKRYLTCLLDVLAQARALGGFVAGGSQVSKQRLEDLRKETDRLKELLDKLNRATTAEEKRKATDEMRVYADTRKELTRMQNWSYRWIEELTAPEATAPPTARTSSAKEEADQPADLPKTSGATAEPRKNGSAEEELLHKAYSAYNLGDFNKARALFVDVLRLNPENAAARRGMERAEQRLAEAFDVARDQLRSKMLEEIEEWQGVKPKSGRGIYYAQKMWQIVFPQVQFTNASVEEVVEFLRIKSRDYDRDEKDPSKRGVILIMKRGPTPSTALITLDLKDVTMAEALRSVSELAGLKVDIGEHAVIVEQRSNDATDLYTRTFKVLPDFLAAAAHGLPIAGRPTALEVLRARAIPFPAGSSASFIPSTSQLIVRNTEANLARIEALVEELEKKAQKP
jgi:beta-lactamase regulating signal transducer with metallopeptidase domain